VIQVECDACGYYEFDLRDDHWLQLLDPTDLGRLAGVVRRNSSSSDYLRISSENVRALVSQAPDPIDVGENARSLLRSLARRSRFAGYYGHFVPERDKAEGYAASLEQIAFLFDYLLSQKWITAITESSSGGVRHYSLAHFICTEPSTPIKFQLLPSGWEEATRAPRSDSAKAFVAMWFDPRVQAAYEQGIYAAIRTDCRFQPTRLDFEHYNGDVMDKVLAEIRESRFLVADLTAHRNGVYFEAGFAL